MGDWYEANNIPKSMRIDKGASSASSTPSSNSSASSTSSNSSSSSSSGGSSKSKSNKSTSPVYVTDGNGNAYERKYDSNTGTYKDHYVGNASDFKITQGNPDVNSGYTPDTTSGGGIMQGMSQAQKDKFISLLSDSEKQRLGLGGSTQPLNNVIIPPQQQQLINSDYSRIEALLQQILSQKPQEVRKMSWDESVDTAEGKIKPLYASHRTELGRQLDKDAERRGILSSQMGGKIYADKMLELADEEAYQTANLASSLQNQEYNQALSEANLAAQNQQSLLSQLLSAYQLEQQYIQNDRMREQDQWNQSLQMAGLSGFYQDPVTGEMKQTVDYQKMLNAQKNAEAARAASAANKAREEEATANKNFEAIKKDALEYARKAVKDEFGNTVSYEIDWNLYDAYIDARIGKTDLLANMANSVSASQPAGGHATK